MRKIDIRKEVVPSNNLKKLKGPYHVVKLLKDHDNIYKTKDVGEWKVVV
jgi:hypothetical protein